MLGITGTGLKTHRPFFPKGWNPGFRRFPVRVAPPVQQYLPAQESNRAALAALGLPGRVINAPLASAYSDLLPPLVPPGPKPMITMRFDRSYRPGKLGGYRGPPARFGTGKPTLPPIRLRPGRSEPVRKRKPQGFFGTR